jgi:hypothetical protein
MKEQKFILATELAVIDMIISAFSYSEFLRAKQKRGGKVLRYVSFKMYSHTLNILYQKLSSLLKSQYCSQSILYDSHNKHCLFLYIINRLVVVMEMRSVYFGVGYKYAVK